MPQKFGVEVPVWKYIHATGLVCCKDQDAYSPRRYSNTRVWILIFLNLRFQGVSKLTPQTNTSYEQKWTQLDSPSDAKSIRDWVLGILILHNFLVDAGDNFDEYVDEQENVDYDNETPWATSDLIISCLVVWFD